MNREIIHAMTQHVLNNADKYNWSIQGFGMLRAYLPFDMWLNIWSRNFRIPNVSLIHTHPWHFNSYIERGMLHNLRYQAIRNCDSVNYNCACIKPGPSGGLLAASSPVRLIPGQIETFVPGDFYHQNAHEIHLSDPIDGTVTINARTRVGPDEAMVYWPTHMEWVSAEPREATQDEVREFIKAANSV